MPSTHTTPAHASRIGFDAVRALRNGTGLGNYGRSLLRALRRARPDLALTLYSPAPPRDAYASLVDELGATLRLPDGVWAQPAARALWRTFRLGRRAAQDGIALYHGLTHEVPRDLPRRVPSVVTFHDLLYHRYPALFPAVDRWSYGWRYPWSARRADAIVAVSGQTRADVIEFAGADPARIAVIPPVRDPRFAVPVDAATRRAVLARYELPETFLLSVGTIEARKNHATAVRALAQLDPARTPPLVLIGRDGGALGAVNAAAESLGIRDRVLVRTGVGAADLPAILQSATLFLYPSRFEGFGMPIVEALSAGVPTVTSTGGCFPEAGGPDSAYVPADDAAALAETIRALLDDTERRARMAAAGRRYAERFDGGRLTDALLDVYAAVLEGRPAATAAREYAAIS